MDLQWTEEDDVVAYYLYRVSREKEINSPRLVTLLSLTLNLDPGFMRQRIGFFKKLNDENGMDGIPAQVKSVFTEYGGKSMEALGKDADKIIRRRSPPRGPSSAG